MALARREFLQILAAASAAGLDLSAHAEADPASAEAGLYDLPRFGEVSLLHITDCHAQLLPLHYREPSVNLGAGSTQGQWPHLTGEALLRAAGLAPGSAMAHACTALDFEVGARRFGRVGGFAHLATLVKRLKASRPGALLLDGGDSWQGSATALWTHGQDMVEASKLLGVDAMTGHWEFTLGMDRVRQIIEHDFAGGPAFLAQNVRTADFGDPVFQPSVQRVIQGVKVAVIGQAFPYTPIAHPRHLVAEWTFGIQEEALQQQIDSLRRQGAQVVVLLSHNGMDVDLKLASRVCGLDAILGGHTHDAVPLALPVRNAGGTTLVTNAGSHGKFIGVLDFQVRSGRVADFRYHLLPVFADALPPDSAMAALIARHRQPYLERLNAPLAVTESLLYRRGNFNGSWDQLLCDALMEVQGAEIAFSPGFRWGGTLLPGETITREQLMGQVAITYPHTSRTVMSGAAIKAVLEDVADNLFNPDPYLQQGGDMVRVGGLGYSICPAEPVGRRISELRLGDKLLEPSRNYTVAGWASVAEGAAQAPGAQPVWELVETWMAAQPGGRVSPRAVLQPHIIGMESPSGPQARSAETGR